MAWSVVLARVWSTLPGGCSISGNIIIIIIIIIKSTALEPNFQALPLGAV